MFHTRQCAWLQPSQTVTAKKPDVAKGLDRAGADQTHHPKHGVKLLLLAVSCTASLIILGHQPPFCMGMLPWMYRPRRIIMSRRRMYRGGLPYASSLIGATGTVEEDSCWTGWPGGVRKRLCDMWLTEKGLYSTLRESSATKRC